MKSFVPNDLYKYIIDHTIGKINPILNERIIYSNSLPNNHLMTAIDQVIYIGELAGLINCKKYLEIGVFTGVTALSVMLNCPSAEIHLIDSNQDYLDNFQQFVTAHNLGNSITNYVGNGVVQAQTIATNLGNNYFDIIYIDANKSDYINYYYLAKKMISNTGIILIDNVLMRSQVLEQNPERNYVKTLQELNHIINHDQDVTHVILSLGDGLTMVRKNEKKSI